MKLSILTTTFCAAAFAGTVHAQLIGDFEGSLDTGWVVVGNATGAPSTAWSSSGSSSLQITPGPIVANNFDWAVQFNGLATINQLATSHRLTLDVYWDSSEWQPDAGSDGWVRWDIGSIQGDAQGWTQISDTSITDSANPGFPGGWDPNNWGATHQRTLTYDFTGLGFPATGTSWGQFHLAINFGNIENAGNYYIDNVRLTPVPEPSTFALFGLAGLLVVFWRRRR